MCNKNPKILKVGYLGTKCRASFRAWGCRPWCFRAWEFGAFGSLGFWGLRVQASGLALGLKVWGFRV